MDDLTAFQRDLLGVLAGLDEPHGFAIKDGLSDYYGSEIRSGRFYPGLDTLVDKGLVNNGKHDERTNAYTLTRRGRDELRARRDWEKQQLQ